MLDPKRISGGGREVAAARRPAQNAKRTLDVVEGVPSHTIPSVRRKAITGFTAAGRDEEGNDRSSSERQQGEERQTSQQADGQGEEQSGRMEEGGEEGGGMQKKKRYNFLWETRSTSPFTVLFRLAGAQWR